MPNKAFEQWRQARHDELAAPDSWLGLIGLFWLESGMNRVGSAPDATVLLPAGPAHLGNLSWTADGLFWQPLGAAAIPLQTDHAGQPTVIDCEQLSFFIVDREGRLAVRLRDRNWAAGQAFAGVGCFDFDPAWQIEAQWQRLPSPMQLEVPNVSGELKRVELTHRAVFVVNGQQFSLLPMSADEREAFFVFRDRTSGRETYGAGRFLKAAILSEGRILLDFNRAYNPPCAFTSFATCPLPPPENWLPLAVPAGEKKPADAVH